MICDNCKEAADTNEPKLHCGNPDEISLGCFCAHRFEEKKVEIVRTKKARGKKVATLDPL